MMTPRFLLIAFLIASHISTFTCAYYAGNKHRQNADYEKIIHDNTTMLNHYRQSLQSYRNLAENYAAEARLNLAARVDADQSVMAYLENLNEDHNHACLDKHAISLLNHLIPANGSTETRTRSQRHDPVPSIKKP